MSFNFNTNIDNLWQTSSDSPSNCIQCAAPLNWHLEKCQYCGVFFQRKKVIQEQPVIKLENCYFEGKLSDLIHQFPNGQIAYNQMLAVKKETNRQGFIGGIFGIAGSSINF